MYDVFVEVRPADEPPFVSALRATFDASAAAQLRPGSTLAVLYAPGEHDRVDRAREETTE